MPSSYSRIILHSVWSTKYREPWIHPEIEPELFGVMMAEFKNKGCTVIQIGGSDDHVHVLHTLPRTVCIADVISAVKAVSSAWFSERDEKYRHFSWQTGYGSFSVSYRSVDGTKAYIKNQRKRHGTDGVQQDFETEFTTMLLRHGHDDYTPEYLFPNRAV